MGRIGKALRAIHARDAAIAARQGGGTTRREELAEYLAGLAHHADIQIVSGGLTTGDIAWAHSRAKNIRRGYPD